MICHDVCNRHFFIRFLYKHFNREWCMSYAYANTLDLLYDKKLTSFQVFPHIHTNYPIKARRKTRTSERKETKTYVKIGVFATTK